MPSLNKVHIDSLLTNYSQRYKNAAFVNEALFPEVLVEKESDLYAVYGLEMFNIYESRRANGARSNEVDWTVSNERYACEQYSLSDIVTDRERSNADKPLTVDIDTLEFLQDTIDLGKEYRAAQIARNAANYVSGNTSAVTAKWNDYTTGTTTSHPLSDMNEAKLAVWKSARKMPNTIVIPSTVAMTLSLHPDILELRKFTNPDLMTNSGLPPVLQGMKVVEGGAGYNTANAGQTAELGDVWGTDVILAYVDPKPSIKSLQYGITFRTTKYVRKWREEPREGDMVEVNDIYDLAMVASGCGYLIQSVQ
ncbi:hypothetical protein [Alicyclobacillus fastidiosus]|uniref:Phage capsid protein n=1 Tax=Alicyclobacillus fastidiosus TaxID=392011 RepID=A0ABV5AK74_9BACL|nr:hypothetical protein [Alicyclobacillus fastidiosus]WEH09273.1 hypothetical protein PYS47_21790 [Alicyclobacillus fastidiosus]